MNGVIAPLAEKEERAGRTRYKLPARYCRVEGKINIERVGPPSTKNKYICREEGCSWLRESITSQSARQHAWNHSKTKKSHIFEGHLSAEQLTSLEKEKQCVASKRYRGKQKEKKTQLAKKARTDVSEPVSLNVVAMPCVILIGLLLVLGCRELVTSATAEQRRRETRREKMTTSLVSACDRAQPSR
jgi:hypothetical protein